MRDQESLLAAIVESANDSIVSKTLDGIITSWNLASERMFGHSSEETIGKPVTLFTPKEWTDEMVVILDEIMKGKNLGHYETMRVRKDGERILVSLTVSPIHDADGAIIGTSSITRNVTAQKLASGYARSLIEASLDPFVMISIAGKITDVNEATVNITGVAREGLIGTDFSDYFTEPDKAREGYQRVFAEEAITDYPLTICHRDGTLADVLYNASVYRDTAGHVLGVFAAARDVTAQKQAQESERSKETERLDELERFHRLTIGRELKMIKMKKEIKRLTSLLPADSGGSNDEP